MEFRTGLAVKPKEVLRSGQVVFTDGTTDVTPNQIDCEAYGYTYNHITQTCEAYSYTMRIQQTLSNETNTIKGSTNSTETGTANTYVIGDSNVVKGEARNNIIVGNNNEIANGLNNVSVFGSYGIAIRPGENVLGGNGFNGLGKGFCQASTFFLSGKTTDEEPTTIFVDGDSTTTIIARDISSYIGYKFKIIAVRTGGTHAGSVGDRSFLQLEGINDRTVKDESITTIGKTGTVTGWSAATDLTGGNMTLQVTGSANMDISWSVTANFYEIKI